MGREALVVKERYCKHCEGVIYGSAQTVSSHAALCKRAQDVGLILPSAIELPKELRRT